MFSEYNQQDATFLNLFISIRLLPTASLDS